jgi:hypothetical protein
MPTPQKGIPSQISLPVRVAFAVVAQGIRIRFGRSMVTVTGVLFGIAFLMSISTGLVLKKGVSAEENLRVEANRMFSFLTAESGQPSGHVMGLIMDGPLQPTEEHLLQKLDALGLARLEVSAPPDVPLPVLSKTQVIRAPMETVATDASAVLWTGDRVPDAGWDAVFAGARQRVLGLTRNVDVAALPPDIKLVRLASAPTEEQQAMARAEAKKTAFRSDWIILISLLVTIIGISNAMLMSVTERFREIGTMKCLGALSSFVRRMFLIESGLMGLVGGLMGCISGLAFSVLAYSLTYGIGLTFRSLWHGLPSLGLAAALSVAAGLVLSTLAALYPASVAANMVPANALRSNV